MAHVEVMAHGTRLYTATLCADEYLVVQIKGAISWLNQLKSQLTTAFVATRRGRRLDEGAHMISFRLMCFGAREWAAQKGPSLKVGFESPNALRWRLDQYEAARLRRACPVGTGPF
jgi:hypothetical protein